MAREFGIIHIRFWDWCIEEEVSDHSRIVGAYILTCRHGNSLGCFRMPPSYAAADLGWSTDKVKRAYQELSEKGFLMLCEVTQFVFMPNYLKFNPIKNESHGKGTIKIAKTISKKFSYVPELIRVLTLYGDKIPQSLTTEFTQSSTQCDTQCDTPCATPCDDKEKEKETGTETDKTDSCSGLQVTHEPAMSILLIRKDGEFDIFLEDINEWIETFPAVDVVQELKKIRLWNKNNPTRRKTAKGVRNHIASWLGKEQDKGGQRRDSRPKPTTYKQNQMAELTELLYEEGESRDLLQ